MDPGINPRSVKIHIYSPSLTTVIGFFWAQLNSVDEADTELKLLILAHNEEVRSRGRGKVREMLPQQRVTDPGIRNPGGGKNTIK